MKKNRIKTFIPFFLVPLFSFANNLTQIESTYNKHWPLKMNSRESFDVASKCEMLVFIEVFNQYSSFSETSLAQNINIEYINFQAINQWENETKARIITNLSQLSDESLKDVIYLDKNSKWEILSLIELDKNLPTNFLTWYKTTKIFYAGYVKEQFRLAALFPRITSEILQFSANEIQGHNFSDKNFMLTFDDGPTLINGNTDKLIKVLESYSLTGMFFVLGENFAKRLEASSIKSIKELYGENRVFSHGKKHKAHQKYAEWKESIDYTNNLIHNIFPNENKNELIYFRPPYGQRNIAIVDYFRSKESKLIFWNIDSRDWSSQLNVQQVANRQIKLMLLWRKGILLFHDIHSKAQKVTPIIYMYFKDSEITWMNPNEF